MGQLAVQYLKIGSDFIRDPSRGLFPNFLEGAFLVGPHGLYCYGDLVNSDVGSGDEEIERSVG